MSQYSPSVTPPTHPLSALMQVATSTREVNLRGSRIPLRLLTAAEVYDLLTSVPVVHPPMMALGGQMVENRRDAAFLAAEAERSRLIRLGELAIAMSLPGLDGRPWSAHTDNGERRAYLIHAAKELSRHLLASEVTALEGTLRDMEQAIEKDVRGNSSGPAGATT